ncbi:MAG TPA: Gldg family protein [Kiritimatiellia bacterium]|nr:Gldg family protein [Kiritimatiellia bacterium]
MNHTSSKEKKVNPWVGVLVIFAVLVALNVVAKSIRLRVDMTSEQLFTLSTGAENFLREVNAPVTLKLYASRGNHVPGMLKQYIQRTVDLLKEMERASRGMIVLEVYDPKPDSDEEEWAQRYGVAGQPINPYGGDFVYLGLVAISGQREASIPFLAPNAEAQMEYNITRIIHEVTRSSKPRIGVLSNLPVMGMPRPPSMRGRQPPDSSWMLIRELRRHYDVVPVRAETEAVPDDLTTLLVIHPKRISDITLYAIDQFVMRGGRLIVLQDPYSITEREFNQDSSTMGMMMGFGSDLNRLTASWGAEMITGDVVADINAASPITFGSGQTERLPTWLSLRNENVNRDDALTAGIRSIMLPFAGGFNLIDVQGVTSTPLLFTSGEASLINSFQAVMPGPEKMRGARPAQGSLPLAVRLTGKFPSAFGDGPPANEEGVPVATAEQHKSEGDVETMVILIGDVDFAYDQHAFRAMNIMGQTMVEFVNDNFSFVLSAVEQGAGSASLIGLRSRGLEDRAFSRVLALETAAQQRWQTEELNLMEKLQETQRRLSELQMARDENQQLIVSPEQQAELENFRRIRFETQRELKDVRRNLRSEIERLGHQVKVVNMAVVPLFVTIFGIYHSWSRRRG